MIVNLHQMLELAIAVLREEAGGNPYYSGAADDAQHLLRWYRAGAQGRAPRPYSGARNPLRTAIFDIFSELACALHHAKRDGKILGSALAARKAAAKCLRLPYSQYSRLTSVRFYSVVGPDTSLTLLDQ